MVVREISRTKQLPHEGLGLLGDALPGLHVVRRSRRLRGYRTSRIGPRGSRNDLGQPTLPVAKRESAWVAAVAVMAAGRWYFHYLQRAQHSDMCPMAIVHWHMRCRVPWACLLARNNTLVRSSPCLAARESLGCCHQARALASRVAGDQVAPGCQVAHIDSGSALPRLACRSHRHRNESERVCRTHRSSRPFCGNGCL